MEDNKQFTPKSNQYEVTKVKYITSLDSRGYMCLYEYRANGNEYSWDSETGEVYMTKIWKALGYEKDDIRDALKDPTLSFKSLRGGILKIQGTWVPYDIAKSKCYEIAESISDQLTPIFGHEIVNKSIKSNHTRNKHAKSDIAGLSNRDMNTHLDESNTLNHLNLGKRKRAHSIETPSSYVDTYIKNIPSSSSKIKSSNSSFGTSFDVSSPSSSSSSSLSSSSSSLSLSLSSSSSLPKIDSLDTRDYNKYNNNDDDYINYNDSFTNNNISNDEGIVPDHVYQNNNNNNKNNNSNTKTPNPAVSNFRIVPILSQQDDNDATVPSYVDDDNDTLHHSMLENMNDQLNKSEKKSRNTWKDMANMIEASTILLALSNNSQILQQTVPETFVVDGMIFKIFWN